WTSRDWIRWGRTRSVKAFTRWVEGCEVDGSRPWSVGGVGARSGGRAHGSSGTMRGCWLKG
ncbi:MAG TPA: hypothetical protein VEX38_00565, partial [Fimbriimonadaceae bacterium]|nr:hypothetical protein [Fimbriimonadaceae bacterium]